MLRYLVGRIDRHPKGRKPGSHILCPASGTVEAICHTERGCVSLGNFCVVEALKQDSWRISNLPMKDDRTIANLIMEDYSELNRLKGKRDWKTDAAEGARVKFRENMSGVLNAAHHKAEELIRKDKVRLKEAIMEDIAFLKDQLFGERKGKVGTLDTE